MQSATYPLGPLTTVSRCETLAGSAHARATSPLPAWFTTGDYADELVALSGYGRNVTDVAGELHSRIARIRRKAISYRRDQADREIARLEAMRDAKEGWDGYCAAPPIASTISLASELLRQFADSGLPIPTATMSPSGNAALFNHFQGIYFDIELHADNSISWLLQLSSGPEIESTEPYDGQPSALRVLNILKHVPGAIP